MKIAIAQINPIIADIDGNRNKIITFIKGAEKLGAELVIFPEMATIGYPPMDLLEKKKLIDDNLMSLESIAGACVNIAAICGYVEYNRKNSPMLYNSAAFMHGGKILSSHHKTLLPAYDVFDESRYFSSGDKQTTVKFKGKTLGITICEDIWNDMDFQNKYMEYRRYSVDPVKNLAQMKIDLLINISASPYVRGKNTIKWKMISEVAGKNRLPVIYVNQTGGNDSLIFDGNSFFMNSSGDFIDKARSFDEDLMIIEDGAQDKAPYPQEHELEDVRRALVMGLRDYVQKCGFKSVVIGLSGGIDSALTAVLAVEAVGKENVMGITMPSPYSSKGSIDDSFKLAKNLGIRIETIRISDIYGNYKTLLKNIFDGMAEDVTEENIQARIRGNILMAVSNKFDSLLLTTGNKSELSMGYCTLYGDMSGGLAVISDLPKTLVYRLAEHINSSGEVIPQETLTKPPSAELRENQRDEDSLPPYSMLDQILECYIEKMMSAAEIIKAGFPADIVRDVLLKVDRNEYKRRQAPPGLKVTSKAFGIGRRVPIVQKYKP